MHERTGRPYTKVQTRTQSENDEEKRSPDHIEPGVHGSNMKEHREQEKKDAIQKCRGGYGRDKFQGTFFAGSVVARNGNDYRHRSESRL